MVVLICALHRGPLVVAIAILCMMAINMRRDAPPAGTAERKGGRLKHNRLTGLDVEITPTKLTTSVKLGSTPYAAGKYVNQL